MDTEGHRRIAAAVAKAAGKNADPESISAAVEFALQATVAALAPVVGQRGVAAIYQRSLSLASAAHPWLRGLHDEIQPALDTRPLRALLAQRTSAEATEGGVGVLQAFHELLATLIGASLTEQLFLSAWETTSSGRPAQDNPS